MMAKRMTTLTVMNRLSLSLVVFILFCTGCGETKIDDPQGTLKQVITGDPDTDQDSTVDNDNGDKTGSSVEVKEIEDSGVGLQVKSIALLRSSISSCMGEGMTLIKEDMILPSDISIVLPDPEDGKIRFLAANTYQAGVDIIDTEAKNLLDPNASERTGTASDGLTATYLRSLEVIANVVAHNCSSDNSHCRCKGKEQAMELLTRCLPRLDPDTEEMSYASEYLGLMCTDDITDIRKVVASLLSSYAFATAR